MAGRTRGIPNVSERRTSPTRWLITRDGRAMMGPGSGDPDHDRGPERNRPAGGLRMRRAIAVTSHAEAPARPLRVVLVGLGPIGKNVADECARRGSEHVQVVGAVDVDPAKVGKTLGDLWGPGRPDG